MSDNSISDDLKDEFFSSGETSKTDLANVCELLLNEKWRRRKTRLRDRSIASLSTLETIADIYDVKFLRDWIDYYTEYVTSEGGKGRSEIVDITKFSIDRQNDMNKELLEVLGRR